MSPPSVLVFTFITAAHFRLRRETGASAVVLTVSIVAARAVLVTFIFTELIHEPASIATLLAILALGIGLDLGWKRVRAGRPKQVQVVQ